MKLTAEVGDLTWSSNMGQLRKGGSRINLLGLDPSLPHLTPSGQFCSSHSLLLWPDLCRRDSTALGLSCIVFLCFLPSASLKPQWEAPVGTHWHSFTHMSPECARNKHPNWQCSSPTEWEPVDKCSPILRCTPWGPMRSNQCISSDLHWISLLWG